MNKDKAKTRLQSKKLEETMQSAEEGNQEGEENTPGTSDQGTSSHDAGGRGQGSGNKGTGGGGGEINYIDIINKDIKRFKAENTKEIVYYTQFGSVLAKQIRDKVWNPANWENNQKIIEKIYKWLPKEWYEAHSIINKMIEYDGFNYDILLEKHMPNILEHLTDYIILAMAVGNRGTNLEKATRKMKVEGARAVGKAKTNLNLVYGKASQVRIDELTPARCLLLLPEITCNCMQYCDEGILSECAYPFRAQAINLLINWDNKEHVYASMYASWLLSTTVGMDAELAAERAYNFVKVAVTKSKISAARKATYQADVLDKLRTEIGRMATLWRNFGKQ